LFDRRQALDGAGMELARVKEQPVTLGRLIQLAELAITGRQVD
jgi:hypothetical protein